MFYLQQFFEDFKKKWPLSSPRNRSKPSAKYLLLPKNGGIQTVWSALSLEFQETLLHRRRGWITWGGSLPLMQALQNQKWRCSTLMFAKASIYVYIYIPRTLSWPLVWLEFRPCFGGLTFKNRGQLGSRYMYIYICVWNVTVIRHPFRTDLQSFIDSSLHIQCPTQFLSTKCCIWRSVQRVSSMSALQRCPRTGKALKER